MRSGICGFESGKFPFFLRMRNRAGFLLNKRLTCVAECLDRYDMMEEVGEEGLMVLAAAMLMDFDARTVGAATLNMVESGRRRDIAIRCELFTENE